MLTGGIGEDISAACWKKLGAKIAQNWYPETVRWDLVDATKEMELNWIGRSREMHFSRSGTEKISKKKVFEKTSFQCFKLTVVTDVNNQ